MTELGERRPVRYVVVPKDGTDVLHLDPGERCQLDDTEREEVIDEGTALAMAISGKARLCGHCWPTEAPSQ